VAAIQAIRGDLGVYGLSRAELKEPFGTASLRKRLGKARSSNSVSCDCVWLAGCAGSGIGFEDDAAIAQMDLVARSELQSAGGTLWDGQSAAVAKN
jgi:hypothetical protein